MIIKSTIFRAYDIRGIAFQDFDEDGFFVISSAFGKYIAEKFDIVNPQIFVSGDGRLSMPELYPSVISGLEAVGCEVTWGGILPTPINYFAFHEGGFDAAIQITASHNPANNNGLKFIDRQGAVCGEDIQKIKEIAECKNCRKTINLGKCIEQCRKIDFFSKYQDKLHEITKMQNTCKIVVDAGNGVSGMFFPEVLKSFNHEVIELFCNLDASFPNHQPDPERLENLQDLIHKVKEEKADYGFAYDGDGDRLGVVLKNGKILSADKILFVLAADFLSRHKKQKIVVDAMSSATLIEKINKIGGEVIVSKTGHSYIEEKMKENGALLAGEQSGHFMFGENFYGHDDALLATLRFIIAIQNNPLLLHEVTEDWTELLEFSEKFDASDEKKFKILDKIIKELLLQFPKAVTLDGIRIDFSKGEWAIIRCSNTSPKIAVRIEALNEKSLNNKKKLLLGILKKYLD